MGECSLDEMDNYVIDTGKPPAKVHIGELQFFQNKNFSLMSYYSLFRRQNREFSIYSLVEE